MTKVTFVYESGQHSEVPVQEGFVGHVKDDLDGGELSLAYLTHDGASLPLDVISQDAYVIPSSWLSVARAKRIKDFKKSLAEKKSASLYSLGEEYQQLTVTIQNLVEEGTDEGLVEAIQGYMTGKGAELNKKVDRYIGIIRFFESQAAQRKIAKERVEKLQKSAETAAKAMKQRLSDWMVATDRKTLETIENKITSALSPWKALVLKDARLLPDEYVIHEYSLPEAIESLGDSIRSGAAEVTIQVKTPEGLKEYGLATTEIPDLDKLSKKLKADKKTELTVPNPDWKQGSDEPKEIIVAEFPPRGHHILF